MVLPIVTPAPVVVSHADAFRGLFDNQRAFRHFQNYCSLAKIAYSSLFDKANSSYEWPQETHRCHRSVLAPWHDGRREEKQSA